MTAAVPEFTMPVYWTHPEGIYEASLVDFESEVGEYGPKVRWVFETGVEREDGKPPRLYHRTGTSFGKKSNLVAMLSSLGLDLPSNPAEAAAFSPNDLVGLRCRIQVQHSLKNDASGDVWANIVRFAPLKGQAAATRPQGTQPPAAPVPEPATNGTNPPVGHPDHDPFE